MKRISILLALTLSLSLLSACGGNEPAASTGNPSSESSADSQQVPDGSAEQTAGIGADFLSPEYDYILLVIAFLISPYGLPMAAIWLLGKVQDLKFIIQDLVYG